MPAMNHDERRLFADSIGQVLGDLYTPGARAAFAREPGGFRAANWATYAELGWLGAMFDEGAGGYGDGISEAMLLFEALGRYLVVEPLLECALLPGHVLTRLPGTRTSELVGAIIAGDSRPVLLDGAPGWEGHRTLFKVVRLDEGYRISGRVAVARAGSSADTFLVHAVDEDGASLLLKINAEMPGLTKSIFKMVDAAEAAGIELDGVIVPEEALLARGQEVSAALQSAYRVATLAICAEAVGAMDRCVWITRDYLTTRKQFGQPLSAFQALQHRMADMLVELELARALVHRVTINFFDASELDRDRLVSACKVTIARAGKFISANSVQLHGAMGVTDEYIIGHYFKRLLTIAYQFGDADFHRNRFANA